MANENVDGAPEGLDRRALVKKLAIGAFTAPVIASFGLDSIARAGTFDGRKHGHQACPNQTWGNQTDGNQSVGNQSWGDQSEANQTVGNQTWGDQAVGNQTKPPCDDGNKGKRHPKHDQPDAPPS
jgi:hypothetical protein